MNNLIFQTPSWFILIAFIIAAAYAVFLYSAKSNLSKNLKIALAILRGLLVFTIVFLLLKPLIRSNSIKTLKPVMVLGLDLSSSINLVGDELKQKIQEGISALSESLPSDKYDVVIRDLEGNSIDLKNELTFKEKQTDFGNFFRNIEEEFAGQNLAEVVLLSDGIANSGYTPVSKNFPYKIRTIGVGDTTIQRDLAISGVTSNKLAYLGNDFPIKVSISSSLLGGRQTKLRVKRDGLVVSEKLISINSNDFFQDFDFMVNASEAGVQRYQIEVIPLGGEKSTANNYRNIIIEVVDGKEKVLILALNPHPDLKALRSILTKNELLDVEILNLQSGDLAGIENKDFDMLILHQLPDVYDAGNNIITKLLSKRKPTFFILGALSNISRFNGMQEVLGINGAGNKTDKVLGAMNPAFKQFNLQEDGESLLAKLPPLIAPFGEYKAFAGTQSVLYQQVGSLKTERPLLAINTGVARKTAVLSGEGLWKWRMEEFSLNKEHNYVDEIILKTLQLLSLKENKDKLRLYPVSNTFDVDESVKIQSEAYNNLLERIYDLDVTLNVKGPDGYSNTFNYKINEADPIFELSSLKEGVYTFNATSSILGKEEAAKGQFVISSKDLEYFQTRADHNLLRTLSSNSEGKFYNLSQISAIADDITELNVPSKIISSEDLKELINFKWLLALIIILLTLEWIIRKYKGTY